jgi:outer membrane protein, heavy metal efflux system
MKKIVFLIVLPFFIKAQTVYTLQKVLQSAKTNNRTIKADLMTFNMAQTEIITAKLRPNPVLNNQSLQLTDPNYFPTGIGYENGKTRQIWWQLTKPFQLPAQRKYKVDLAEKKIMFAQDLHNNNERNVLLEVAEKWLAAWRAKKEVELIRSTKNTLDSMINLVRTESQAPTLLSAQYALRLKSAEQEYRNELLVLKFLSGSKEDIDVDTDKDPDFKFSDLNELIKNAMGSRPDISALHSEIEVSASAVKLQKVMARPVPELGAIYNPQNTIPYLGVFGTLQIPIFSRNQGEIKKASLQKQYAEISLENAQQQLQTELTVLYNSCVTQKQIVSDYSVILEQSQTIIKKADSATDHIEVRKNNLEIQQMYLEYKTQYYRNCIKLLHAAGMISKFGE